MIVAAIDVGSYSTRLTVARIEGGKINILREEGRITSLGSGVKERGYLRRDRIEETISVLEIYSRIIKEMGAEKVLAVGTEALRRAKNSEEFLREVRERTGIHIKVISPEEEGKLAYLATVYSLELRGKSLVIDQGGGSTEFIFGESYNISRVVSLPIGIVSLTEEFLRSDPPKGGEIDELYNFLEQKISPLVEEVDNIVGLGGTITTLVALEYGVYPYRSEAIHGRELSLGAIKRWFDTLARLPYRERSLRYKQVEDKRAEVIVAGIAMFVKILQLFGKDSLRVSDWGLKHGLIVSQVIGAKA
jgi:exopolyphosphatase/guanosine-5'-triphosphate,3'-diphosphate pyrophosphatase